MGALAPKPKAVADPLREALRDAIANLHEIKDRALAAHASRDRAQSNIEAARTRLATASDAVTSARERYSLVLIKAAQDDTSAPANKTLRDAKVEAEIAADEAAAAEHAHSTLAEAAADADEALQRAELDVSNAADTLIAGRAPDILAAAEALAQSLSGKILELMFMFEVLRRVGEAKSLWLVSTRANTSEALAALNAKPEDTTAKSIERFLLNHPLYEVDWRTDPALEDWRCCERALRAGDAEVVLP